MPVLSFDYHKLMHFTVINSRVITEYRTSFQDKMVIDVFKKILWQLMKVIVAFKNKTKQNKELE